MYGATHEIFAWSCSVVNSKKSSLSLVLRCQDSDVLRSNKNIVYLCEVGICLLVLKVALVVSADGGVPLLNCKPRKAESTSTKFKGNTQDLSQLDKIICLLLASFSQLLGF